MVAFPSSIGGAGVGGGCRGFQEELQTKESQREADSRSHWKAWNSSLHTK